MTTVLVVDDKEMLRDSVGVTLQRAGFTVLAAFAVVTLVRDVDGEATHLSRWAGLGRRSPLYATLFTFILLAFAGIPLTSGSVSYTHLTLPTKRIV